jgi:iron-sulfur cluster assembly accessory protein
MITLTSKAILKVKEIMKMQDPVPGGLRIAVIGGGCSGFSYHMAFVGQQETDARKARANEKGEEALPRDIDDIQDFDGLSVFVDQMSAMYLDGVTLDWEEMAVGGELKAGFKFNNPNVKAQCGCGSSFTV